MENFKIPSCAEEFGTDCLWLIGSHVKLDLGNIVVEGTLTAIDPISGNVILQAEKSTEFIMGHAIVKWEVLKPGSGVRLAQIEGCAVDPHTIDPDTAKLRKEKFKKIMDQHMIPYEEIDNDKLVISDVVTVTPPYREEDISSFNEVVLARIQKLLNCLDSKS